MPATSARTALNRVCADFSKGKGERGNLRKGALKKGIGFNWEHEKRGNLEKESAKGKTIHEQRSKKRVRRNNRSKKTLTFPPPQKRENAKLVVVPTRGTKNNEVTQGGKTNGKGGILGGVVLGKKSDAAGGSFTPFRKGNKSWREKGKKWGIEEEFGPIALKSFLERVATKEGNVGVESVKV